MRILWVMLLFEAAVCAMDGFPKNPTLVKIAQHGSSVLNFIKSIPDTVREALPSVLQDSSGSEEESSGSRSSPEATTPTMITSRALQESPPKTYLAEEAYLGALIPDMPILFHIQNKSQVMVNLVVILTTPFRPKRYILQPQHDMMMLAPNNAEFQQVFVMQSEDNKHIAEFNFTSAAFVKLFIEHHMYIKNQLCIRKQIEY